MILGHNFRLNLIHILILTSVMPRIRVNAKYGICHHLRDEMQFV